MELLTPLGGAFARARGDSSSSAVGGFISSLLVEDYDEEAIWQQLELTHKQFCNKLSRPGTRGEFQLADVKESRSKKQKLAEEPQSDELDDNDEDGSDLPENRALLGADEEGDEDEEDEDDEDEEEEGEKFIPRGDDGVKEGVNDGFFDLDEMNKFLDEQDRQALNAGDDDDDDEEEDEDDDGEGDDEDEGMDGDEDADIDGGMEGDLADYDGSGGDSDSAGSDVENGHQSSGISATDLESMSAHERRVHKLRREYAELEEQNLKPKSWEMSGEASAPARPENSLLEEHLEVDHIASTAPEATEERTKTLEDKIIQRIKDQAWDDVVRREKPVEKPYEYRKSTPLDQEKSKLSLAQVYEKEYIDQLQKDAPKEEPEEIKDIRRRAKLLFASLDALCNYHYTPKGPSEDVKIVTNRPAIEVEEVIPAATSDATLLAPGEVMPSAKGEAKGKTERTETDRKRERRAKKATQRLRAAKQQKKLKKGGKTAAAIDHVKKQAKIGKVKLVSQDQSTDKAIKSSSAFFAKLQDQATSAVSKAKAAAAASASA